MKVLQTIQSMSFRAGGTTTCSLDLLKALETVGADVDLLTFCDSSQTETAGYGSKWLKLISNDCKTPLRLSANMKKALLESDCDIYHTNGMWQHVNHLTASVARSKKKPFVLTPHGMLYPEALARSAWKKWPMRKLWFDRDIAMATCIHATCQDEMCHVRALGYKGPVAVIGNPVDVPDVTEQLCNEHIHCLEPYKTVAYLGRLHARKKVENLIAGVALASDSSIRVEILGTGHEDYEQFLRAEVERLGLTYRVNFRGFVSGKEKFERLAKCDALFVPSDMENFGMIIPEALLVGTPVMASLGTPWQALNTEGCGWWCDNSPEQIAKVIDTLYAMPQAERAAMGQRGRRYILNNFTSEKIGLQMKQLYQWLSGQCEKPEFVFVE